MAISNYTDYKSKIASPYQNIHDTKISLTTVAGRAFSFWRIAPDAGVTPTTGSAPNKSTAGAISIVDSSGVQRIAQMECSQVNGGYFLICDRLSQQGGLSGIDATAQTTNLPTVALTRYTTGVGVFAALEIHTQIGTTATTVSMSYTNSAGTAGRTTPLTVIGGTGFREASRFIIMPLAPGDVGVRSVESVTLTATTGTAGAFGVTLFKPLFAAPIPPAGGQQILADSVIGLGGNMPEVVANACLSYVYIANTSATGIVQNSIKIIEE